MCEGEEDSWDPWAGDSSQPLTLTGPTCFVSWIPSCRLPFPPLPSQLTAFAYKDYVSFGYVYIGLRGVEEMTREYNINIYAPTMLIFKEHINKPADVIQVRENHLLSRRPSVYLSLQQISNRWSELCSPSPGRAGVQGHSPLHKESGASLSYKETLSQWKSRESSRGLSGWEC